MVVWPTQLSESQFRLYGGEFCHFSHFDVCDRPTVSCSFVMYIGLAYQTQ